MCVRGAASVPDWPRVWLHDGLGIVVCVFVGLPVNGEAVEGRDMINNCSLIMDLISDVLLHFTPFYYIFIISPLLW